MKNFIVDKKSILIWIIFLIFCVSFVYIFVFNYIIFTNYNIKEGGFISEDLYSTQKNKPVDYKKLEEDATAPSDEPPIISSDLGEQISAPKNNAKIQVVSPDVINGLTAPDSSNQ